MTKDFLEHYPEAHFVDYLQSENDKKQFILAFRDIIKNTQRFKSMMSLRRMLPTSEWQNSSLWTSAASILTYTIPLLPRVLKTKRLSSSWGRSGYVWWARSDSGWSNWAWRCGFCLELLHSDIINVAYILELIADLNPYSEDYSEKRKHIIDTMIKDAELRSKAKLIDGFIQKNVDDDRDNFMARKQKADGTSDLEERLNNYIVTERNNAVNTLAKDEDLDASVLNHYLSEYDYLQKNNQKSYKRHWKRNTWDW